MLTREEILLKTSLKKEVLKVEEWGGDIIVSEMSGEARDVWEQSLREKSPTGKIISPRAKLVAFTVVDEQGERVFKDDDIASIGKLSSDALEKICLVAMRLNGLGAGDVDNEKKS